MPVQGPHYAVRPTCYAGVPELARPRLASRGLETAGAVHAFDLDP